ncbi:oxygen-insensitive NAD(P)H nitroreductase [Lutibacter citreus]|uniref:oxygen-insensitive NAD(P)H nitroreductase n=1 Tax=Lutibacter citreus TaxID=2138210 RepID=UPI000DBE1B97|nr:oxygen-insensitive NAD(P)H nitroreductase [Lutibacter citreus]
MNLTKILNNRYSVKEFDATKKISDSDFEQIKSILRLCPSSANLQPWHFLIADTTEGKERIAKGTQGFFKLNTPKVLDASHVIVFAVRTDVDETYMKSILEQEDKDGRFTEKEFRDQMHGGRLLFTNIHRFDLKDLPHWLEKQVYLNMGALLLGAASLGIDACIMEALDLKALDEEFGLREKGFKALTVVSLGYRKESDFNVKLPKSRFLEKTIITQL